MHCLHVCVRRRHERPPAPHDHLRIYEAHVGMSSEEPKVATYTEFKDVVLPKIKAQGYTAIQLMAVQVGCITAAAAACSCC